MEHGRRHARCSAPRSYGLAASSRRHDGAAAPTSPSPRRSPSGAGTRSRFLHGLSSPARARRLPAGLHRLGALRPRAAAPCLWHELALIAAVGRRSSALTWGAPNQIGLWTFVVLLVDAGSAPSSTSSSACRNLNERVPAGASRAISQSYFRRAADEPAASRSRSRPPTRRRRAAGSSARGATRRPASRRPASRLLATLIGAGAARALVPGAAAAGRGALELDAEPALAAGRARHRRHDHSRRRAAATATPHSREPEQEDDA